MIKKSSLLNKLNNKYILFPAVITFILSCLLVLYDLRPDIFTVWSSNYPYIRFKYLAGVDLPSTVVSSGIINSPDGIDGWELYGFEGNENIIKKWVEETKKENLLNWKKGPVLINNAYFLIDIIPGTKMNVFSSNTEYCFVYVTPVERSSNCVLVLVNPDHKTIWIIHLGINLIS